MAPRQLHPTQSTPTEVFVAPLSLSLQKLRLGDNRLGDEVFSVLSELTSLEVLNLSFNEIFEIPDFSLQTLTKLRELYVSGNQLSTIPFGRSGGAAGASDPASQLEQAYHAARRAGQAQEARQSGRRQQRAQVQHRQLALRLELEHESRAALPQPLGQHAPGDQDQAQRDGLHAQVQHLGL
ncbi:hypothetical protein L1887_48910 [Cichorium endivia]|nr:hypothetical protein L1887_48910 [Cichorium endivia]